MRALELRVPPPVVAGATALLMWLIASGLPGVRFVFPGRVAAAIVLALLGSLISIAGVVEFRRARTTVNPMKPSNASSLVVTGVYKITRNPMYLGFTFILLGWAIFLGSPASLLALVGSVYYLTRFQIIPEERALQAVFGTDFEAYRRKVRRWL